MRLEPKEKLGYNGKKLLLKEKGINMKNLTLKDYLDSISGKPSGHPEFPGVIIHWAEESGPYKATNGFWISVNIEFRDRFYISYDELLDNYKEQKEYIDNNLREKVNRLFSLMERTMALYKNKNIGKKRNN